MFYIKSPFKPQPALLVQGTPQYLFGSWNANTGPTQGTVISDTGNGTTSTVTFQILSGNIPVVNALVTIVGTANNAGSFNVTNALILTVSAAANPDTGVYTITFAGTAGTPLAADYGQVYIPQPEIGDQLTAALITSGVASAPACSAVAGPDNTGKSLSVTVKLPANTTAIPSTLASVAVYLQGANLDLDAEYNDIAEVVTGGSQGNTYDWQSGQGVPTAPSNALNAGNVLQPNFKFYRLRLATGASGTGPIIGKIIS
jgi:hypothetical protein